MHIVRFVDLETKVLDMDENRRAVGIIKAEATRRKARLGSNFIRTNTGTFSEWQFVHAAEYFSLDISSLDVAQNIAHTNFFMSVLTNIWRKEPNYYELPFLMAKVLLSSLPTLETEILGDGTGIVDVDKARDSILRNYGGARNLLDQAAILYTHYFASEGDFVLGFYADQMRSFIAGSYFDEGMFLRNCAAKFSGREFCQDSVERFISAVDGYSVLVKEGVFIDEPDAARVVMNLANTIAVVPCRETYTQALKYLRAVLSTIGDINGVNERIASLRAGLEDPLVMPAIYMGNQNN